MIKYALLVRKINCYIIECQAVRNAPVLGHLLVSEIRKMLIWLAVMFWTKLLSRGYNRLL